jgi:hypothetical protein
LRSVFMEQIIFINQGWVYSSGLFSTELFFTFMLNSFYFLR